jgi:hypothetical protein
MDRAVMVIEWRPPITTSEYSSCPGVFPSAGCSTFERRFPGRVDQGDKVRAEFRSFLAASPVADEVVAVLWELCANACQHSHSRLPGGWYVYADVRDQGSDWEANLDKATEWPHGLYLLREIASTCGAAGGRRSWRIWFTVDHPVVESKATSSRSGQPGYVVQHHPCSQPPLR